MIQVRGLEGSGWVARLAPTSEVFNWGLLESWQECGESTHGDEVVVVEDAGLVAREEAEEEEDERDEGGEEGKGGQEPHFEYSVVLVTMVVECEEIKMVVMARLWYVKGRTRENSTGGLEKLRTCV
jgi:hypothetical protein